MRFLKRRRAIGVVDTRGGRLQGWAYDASAQGPRTIEIYVDGKKIGSTLADRFRADLIAESPDGKCAFEFAIPEHLRDGSVRSVEVRVAGGGRLLNDRFSAVLTRADYHAGMLRWILRAGAWGMRSNAAGSDAIDITGWWIAPPEVEGGSISVDGHPIAVTFSEGGNGWKSPLPAELPVRAFTGRVPLASGASEMCFSFGLERPFRPLQNLYYPLFEMPVPSAEMRKRVDGNGIASTFNLGGYSNARKFDLIAQRFAGKPLAGLGPVLDWGCGCGRVARFVARSGADIHGIDIDSENALWCREHINKNFHTISPDPPTIFPSNFFGAIYGLSVFTHLNREYEAAWLAELARIAKPGALILLSVHGGLIGGHSGLFEHVHSPEFADGFADIGRNQDIDVVTKGSAYYRNVFHQPGYIAKTWGKFFEILAIEEGIVDNLQDLVVARKPA